eukprot:181816_1
MELQNDGFEAKKQRFFDCSWLSTYAEENERLFIAGKYRLKIPTIRIIETAQNFEPFFHSLYLFDHMISGVDTSYGDIGEISGSDIKILHRLINHSLSIGYESKEDIEQYIVNTFDLFLIKKTKIEINMADLDDYFESINPLIVHCMMNEGGEYKHCMNEDGEYNKNRIWIDKQKRKIKHNDTNDKMNILNAKILSIFPNVNQVVINTTYQFLEERYYVYRFSLWSFLSEIETAKPSITYVMKATPKTGETKTWLTHAVSPYLKRGFTEKKWHIKYKHKKEYDYVIIGKNLFNMWSWL